MITCEPKRMVDMKFCFPSYSNMLLLVRVLSAIILAAATLVFVTACDSPESAKTAVNTPVSDSSFRNYVELGDLPALKERGKLRILLDDASIEVPYFPRQGLPIHFETDLIERFAKQVGLEPEWVYVDKFEKLIPMLIAGKGDVITANLTITPSRKEQVAFTVPVSAATEQLIVRKNEKVNNVTDLHGRHVALLRGTSYWDTMMELKAKQPDINLTQVPSEKSLIEILDGVAKGEYDMTVADSNVASAILPVQPKLKVAFDVSGERPIAWAVRPEAGALRDALNNFLNRENLTRHAQAKYKADLDEIKKRKVLRVLTRNNAATYFLWRGELMGFEYELVKHFAEKNNLRLEMIVPPSREALKQWLVQGKGDLIAASMTIPEKNSSPTLTYSRPYNKVHEIVVGRSDEKEINSITDLAGRKFHVRRSSSYWDRLLKVRQQGVDIKIIPVPENEETEEVIAKVASGEYDLTVSDSHVLDIELTWREDIKGLLNLNGAVDHGWVVRKDSPKLLGAINNFIKKEYRGLFYNITRKKYFEKPKAIARRLEQRVDSVTNGRLSPYDDVARQYAGEYNFDWRLIIAQMYQESRFNPSAKSWAGAVGLMQVMPRTARELGVKNLKDPNLSIKAGVKYLDWLRDRFESELPVQDRMWFALAAYNAGAGHVRDARALARKKGWETTRWFGNVERAMLLLSKRKYAKTAKHGYVRGAEPVKYVREIRNRFLAYVKLTEQAKR